VGQRRRFLVWQRVSGCGGLNASKGPSWCKRLLDPPYIACLAPIWKEFREWWGSAGGFAQHAPVSHWTEQDIKNRVISRLLDSPYIAFLPGRVLAKVRPDCECILSMVLGELELRKAVIASRPSKDAQLMR